MALALSGCAPADARGEQTAALLDDALGDEGGPGCSAAVAEDGEVIWTYVRGLADVEEETPIDTATRFNIGSVSKQFTATAALMLAEQGALALDDAVADFVDGLPPWAEQVTVADLMTHTSGIVDLSFGDRAEPIELEDRLRALDSRQAHRTNTAFHYSDDNYVLLGLVVEEAAGEELDEWIERHIFEPYDLDMAVDPGAAGDGVAIGYRESWAPFTPAPNTYLVPGPTGVIATPSALARWGDHYREPVSLPDDALRRALDAGVPLTGADAGWRYGPGIFASEDGRIEHGGFDAGVSTHFAVSPDRGTTVAISCTRQISQAGMLAEEINAIWFGDGESERPE
ncbi:MAG TPA: serine hydrolase domain-containing protein [Microbacterium sp.]|nr:serine hydrolase domain-containing protein [Microbacterium sp.]